MALLEPAAVDALLARYSVAGVSMAVIQPARGDGCVVAQSAGLACKETNTPMFDATWLQIASLSKTLAAAFMCEYCAAKGISLHCPVNLLLRRAGARFALRPAPGCPAAWAEQVTLAQLVNHTGCGMHYVNGVPLCDPFPPVDELMSGSKSSPAPYGYMSLDLTKAPGTKFGYSGGGFLVLQHLLELRERRPIAEILESWLGAAGMGVGLGLSFEREVPCKQYARGYREDGSPVQGGRLAFPPLAAGGEGTAAALAEWLRQLAVAYRRPEGCGAISHNTARAMLTPGPDLGSEDFMRAQMGLGVFVFEAGEAGLPPSKWMLHQAANDGFRGLYLICFDGPDAARGPRGFVILSNGDNNAMLLNCALARQLLQSFAPALRGVDWHRVPSQEGFTTEGMKQEEIVNLGIRDLVLKAFVKPSRKRRAGDDR